MLLLPLVLLLLLPLPQLLLASLLRTQQGQHSTAEGQWYFFVRATFLTVTTTTVTTTTTASITAAAAAPYWVRHGGAKCRYTKGLEHEP